MRLKRLRSIPFVWLALLLALCETAATFLLPYHDYPRAAEVVRNPIIWRGWPEYVRSGETGSGKRAVIISNSQGVGREMADPGDIYFARLRDYLEADRLSLALENWSLEGLRLAEIEMLTLQAVNRGFDLVVLIVSPMNIDRNVQVKLDFGISDVDLLAGHPSLWRPLRASLIAEQASLHDLFKRSLFLGSSLVRSRTAVHDRLAGMVNMRSHQFVFGQRKNLNAHRRIDQLPERPPRLPERPSLSMSVGNWERLLEAVRRPSFEALFRYLAPRLRDHGVDLLWVWMPLPHEDPTITAIEGARRFQADVCEIIDAEGFRCLDFSRSIPDREFLPLFHWTHLGSAGHRRFAEILYPVIVDAVH